MDIISYDRVQLDKTVVALGKFEGLHRGHMLLMDEVIKIADREDIISVVFTINVNSDKLINLPDERFELLDKMGIDIDVECEFSNEFAAMGPEEFVKSILVDRMGASYVVVGSDFRFGCMRRGDVDFLRACGKKYGFSVIAFDKLKIDDDIVSSSLIRSLVESGRVDLVDKYMGRPYSVSGEVCMGKQLGRTIGFPTINIIPDDNKLLPPNGVYAASIVIDGIAYDGMTNVGSNPTVDDMERIIVETNIFDYDEELYGRNVTVNFVKYIRNEIKFNSVEELKKQIERDKIVIMHQ